MAISLNPDCLDVTKIEELFLKSPGPGPRLRIGLLFERGALLTPSRDILQHLRKCEFIDLVVALHAAPAPRPASSQSLLYRLYRWIDRSTHAGVAKSLAPEGCADLLSGIAPHRIEHDATADRLAIPEFQLAILKSCRLDVILTLGAVANPAALAAAARCGVWQCRLGDEYLGDSEPRIFCHTIECRSPVEASLVAHLDGHADVTTLSRGSVPLATNIWNIRNLAAATKLGECFYVSKLWQLHCAGWEFVLAQRPGSSDAGLAAQPPGNMGMLSWAVSKIFKHIVHRARQFNTGTFWRVGLRVDSPLPGLPGACSADNVSWIEAPRGQYYADPFLFTRDGITHLFIEDFHIGTGKGSISCARVQADGRIDPPVVVLDEPHHLSYPQIFSVGDDVYLMPEAGSRGTIDLYRATGFPLRWELQHTLFRGPAYDATVLQHDNRFWMFVTLVEERAPLCAVMVLFHATALDGNWTLHPASPISTDIRVARSGGALFRDGEHWIRPAQDGGQTYGGALRFQRILQLDTQHYAEEPAGNLTPAQIPGASGVHTYNRVGRFEVLDCKLRLNLADVHPPLR